MHILVYGTGAVGGFFGTMLAKHFKDNPEYEISFIARGKNLEAINQNGIKLDRNKGSENEELINLKVNAREKISEFSKPVDAALVCVKSKDTLSAAKDIKDKLSDKGYTVSIQNGIDNEEKLASVLGEDQVLGCLTNIAAQNPEPGLYTQVGKFNIIFGDVFNKGELKRAESLTKLFKEAGVNAQTSSDMKKDLWSKLVWNAAFNPISALYKLNIGELYANPEHMKVIKGIMDEVVAVAKAEGVDLEEDIAEKHIERTSDPAWRSFQTSMLQDTLRNKAIELDELLGVVIEKAKKHDIATPNASSIYDAFSVHSS